MNPHPICPQCGKPLPATAPQPLCPECLFRAGFPTGRPIPVFTPPTPAELAPLFPHLEIHECIGRGGMGVVYRARQSKLNRVVALKILRPAAAEDPGFAERFTREAQALARLSHPHIVAVHDYGQAQAYHYLLMEFVDGVNLRHLLNTRALSAREALAIVPPVCEALQYAHDRGIVHRDIKPENILLDRAGLVKIADFGLAKLVGADQPGASLTGAGDVMGTPHYMAPEQVEKPAEVDHRADIYSLGVVFYQMLTGELPLGRFSPPSRKVQVDVRLDEIVLRALEKEPGLRYQQVSALRTEVETVARTGLPGGGPRANEPRGRWRPTVLIAAILLPLFLLSAGFYWFWSKATVSPFSHSGATARPAIAAGRASPDGGSVTAKPAEPFRLPIPDSPRAEPEAEPETEPVRESSPPAIPSASERPRSVAMTALSDLPSDIPRTEAEREILRLQLEQAEKTAAAEGGKYQSGLSDELTLSRARTEAAVLTARLANDSAQAMRLKLAAAEKIRQATEARFNAGLATGLELLDAQTEFLVLQAQQQNDPVAVARARLARLEKILSYEEARFAAGLVTGDKRDEARADVRIALIRLREAQADAARPP